VILHSSDSIPPAESGLGVPEAQSLKEMVYDRRHWFTKRIINYLHAENAVIFQLFGFVIDNSSLCNVSIWQKNIEHWLLSHKSSLLPYPC